MFIKWACYWLLSIIPSHETLGGTFWRTLRTQSLMSSQMMITPLSLSLVLCVSKNNKGCYAVISRKKMHALSQGGDEGEKILLCYGLLWKWALSFAKNCQGWMLFEQGEFFQQCLNTLCNPLAHLIGMSLKFAAIHTTNTLVRQPNISRCEGHPYFQYKLGLIFS